MSWDVNLNDMSLKQSFRATLLQGSLTGLLQWPTIKPVDYNNWAEESGIEPDLSELHFNARSCDMAIHFPSQGLMTQALTMMDNRSYNDWSFPFLPGAGVSLRNVASHVEYYKGFVILHLTAIEDKFTYLGIGEESLRTYPCETDTAYRIDGVPFSSYGVKIINDPFSGIMSSGAVKQHLIQTNKLMDGNEYAHRLMNGGEYVPYPHLYGSNMFSVPCFITGPVSQVVMNLFSLFQAVTRLDDGQGDLLAAKRFVTLSGREADCYYQSMNITSLYLDQSKTWLTFNINFVKI